MAHNTEILHSGKIQYWQNGIMIGIISHKEAIKLVDSGIYRIINSQAIEWVGASPDDTD